MPPAQPARFIVLEGSPLGMPKTAGFATEDELRAHVLARLQVLVPADQRARLERAIRDQVVSEDGVRATSEVIAGTLAFLRALCKAYAPSLTITERRVASDEDEE